jgi:hypothetical protein
MRLLSYASAAFALAAAIAPPSSLDAQAETCDRACLRDVVTRYLDSLLAHDPARAPLAERVRFTEDAVELTVGDGLWKTASKLRPFRTDFLDVQTGTAAVHAVIEERGSPALLAARLKVESRRITEIETLVVRNEQEGGLFAPETLVAPSAAMVTPPPRGALMPRAAMMEIALRYPAGLRVGSFARANVPFAADAYRFENGVRMAGVGCTFEPPSCTDMRNQALPIIAEVRPEVVAVDEENGTVLLWMDFGKGTLHGPPGADTEALVTFEAFKIYGGEVHAVEAFFQGMAPGTPRGWN